MPESRSLKEKKNDLPAFEATPGTLSTRNRVIGALAIFAPLAVEVIYSLTRKWLSATTGEISSETSEQGAAKLHPIQKARRVP